MRLTLAATSALIVLAGCAGGPSLDQQQQAWETDIETQACESIKRLNPGSLELTWVMADGREALNGDALRGTQRENSYTCTEEAFDRYYREWLVEEFPDSPKGQAGETTAPMSP